MKSLIRILSPLLMLAILPLYGDVEETAISAEQITQGADERQGPFTFLTIYDALGEADFSKRALHHQKLRFRQAETSLNAVVYYNPQCEEGIAIGAGYTYNYINWRQNPYFDQTSFNAVNAILTGFSKRLRDWDWKAQVFYSLDADHPNFDDYSTWDLLLWGRYTYSCLTGIHFGFYAQTGMKADRVYPVFGFDWQINKEWKLNAIFPVKMSLVYSYDCNWSALLAVRFFTARCRTGKNQALTRGVVEYRNTGLELALRYDWSPTFFADIHGGYTTGGTLKISNRTHNHASHFDFEGSPYVGTTVNFNF